MPGKQNEITVDAKSCGKKPSFYARIFHLFNVKKLMVPMIFVTILSLLGFVLQLVVNLLAIKSSTSRISNLNRV
jgi:hypothetical protein